MCKLKLDPLQRQWFLGPALMLWIGIYLTGFETVHWLIYVPAVMSVFAFVSGICPGQIMICKRQEWFKKFKEKR
jgi:steroid 5-alpha reductase family enzyme